MLVTMAKTPNNGSRGFSTKVPFKKVFSSSHLQTNGIHLVGEHKSRSSQNPNDSIDTMAHRNLSSQLSSSLPGILDNVNASQSPRTQIRADLMVKGKTSSISSQKHNATRSSKVDTFSSSQLLQTSNGIPFSAIEPSLIVSLSSYLTALNNFDSEKLIKEIQMMLIYFEDVVVKDKLEQLVGSATILMDTVNTNCSKLKEAYLQLQQVQLRLQLLSSVSMGTECDTLPQSTTHSSPVVEATNDLYRSLSELLQWSDRITSLHLLQNCNYLKESQPMPSNSTQETHSNANAKKQNIEMVKIVSQKLLQSFKDLVKAYQTMEWELRQCYEDYLNANKQMAELILAESSFPVRSLRRRSITPPPDYSRESSLNLVSGQHRIPNGSTSTIASSTSSSSSNSSHFLARHRFFPTLTNHAQKMAHHFEKKLLSKGKKDNSSVSSKTSTESGSDKQAWSLLPLISSINVGLRRSESASDLSSLPRKSFLDIPADELSGSHQSGRISPYRKHSINETGKSPEALRNVAIHQIANLNGHMRNSDSSQPNRHSDGTNSHSKNVPMPKEMLFNPLYFSPTLDTSHSLSSDNLMSNSRFSPSTSSASSGPTKDSFCQEKASSVTSSCDGDKPPPLPPKTYQARSLGSTRSSIASNTSSNSSTSKDCLRQGFLSKDGDSGFSTMHANSVTQAEVVGSPLYNTPNVKSQLPNNSIENAQVTLRKKKIRTQTSYCRDGCCCQRRNSPPPLPPPESFLFVVNSKVDSSSEFNSQANSHSSYQCKVEHQHMNQLESSESDFSSNVQISLSNVTTSENGGCPKCPHCTAAQRQVFTYRRQQKTQSMAISKCLRSYSITESTESSQVSTTSNCLNVQCSLPHSSSFPHRLTHSVSTYNPSEPPPLPPKRRYMHAYMGVVGNYSGPGDPTDLYRLSAPLTRSTDSKASTMHPTRQTSTSSSIMSLSSSASSSSSLCTNTSTCSASSKMADQYHFLPMAPPPPIEEKADDRERTCTPPPPRLPPRNELPLAPPPPPPVSSSTVIQHRLQLQQVSNCNDKSQIVDTISSGPRSSTPLNQLEAACATQICCHNSPSVENGGIYLQDDLIEVAEDCESGSDEDELALDSNDQKVDSNEPCCCTICNEGTVHAPEECILAQLEIPQHLLALKSADEEDDLGDLTVRAGTVDALIIKATQTSSAGVEATFLQTFLTTYRSFVPPDQLILKLIFRYSHFVNNTERTDIVRQAVANKVVELITTIVNEFYLYDFNKSLLQRLMEFIYQLVGRGDLAHAKYLREKCFEKLRQRERESAPTNKLPHSITTRTATLFDFKSEHIAEQMTLLDSEFFHKIEIPELLIWAKSQNEELIPSLTQFTKHFNKLSYWVRTLILSSEEQKEREKYMLKFMKILKHLRRMHNFNSYVSILSALQSGQVSRLDWPKNTMDILNEHTSLIDCASSFRNYRIALAASKPPCIPYLGLMLQDLTFIDIGNSDFLADGKVNFAKHYKQYCILSQIKLFQHCKYSIQKNEQIISFFDNFDNHLQEDVMWQISESIKPRGGGNFSMSIAASAS